MNGQEQAVTGRLEEYFPDELLKKQVIDKENYETYKRIFNNMINRRRMEPEILRICIDGVWIWNKIHYNVIGQDQLVGFLENYDEQVCQHEKMQEINRKSQLDPLSIFSITGHILNMRWKKLWESAAFSRIQDIQHYFCWILTILNRPMIPWAIWSEMRS